MSKQQFKIEVMDLADTVIGAFTFEATDDFWIELSVEVPELPKRNPLHPKALNIEDLKVGLQIKRQNRYYRSHITNTAVVIGEPFLYGSKHGNDSYQANVLMVPVATTDYSGKLVLEDWFLADMGVTPYVNSPGTRRWWNEQNYTLAVK